MAINLKTDYLVDPKQIVGENLPNVFIKKIILETVNSPSYGAEDRISAHAIDPDNPKNQLSDKSLKVSLDICIKDYYENGKTTWFGNPSVSKIQQNIGVYVVQVTTPEALEIWSKVRTLNDIMWKKDGKLSESGKVAMMGTQISKIGLEEFGQSQNPKDIFQSQPEQDASGKSTYNFVKTISFPTDRKPAMDSSKVFLSNEQKTLAYFAFTMIEPPKNMTNPNVLSTLMGRITSDVVFLNGQIPSESYVFVERNTQRIWGGEVHYHDGDIEVNGRRYTGFMGGPSHGHSANQPLLDRVRTSNDTIIDFRQIDLIKKNVINLVETKKEVLEQTLKVSSKNNDITTTINNTDSYFSDFYSSMDANGNLKFMFGFDMQKYLRDNTVYSKIFSSRKEVISQALRYVKIKSLKIYRNRPQMSRSNKKGPTSNNTFSPTEFSSLATKTFQDNLGDMNEREVMVSPVYGKMVKKKYNVDHANDLIISAHQTGAEIETSFSSGDGKSSVSIMQNPFVENNQDLTGIAMFTGVDKTFSNITQGNYKYSVDMEIEVNLTSMIAEQINILQSSHDTLNKIIDTVTQKGKNSLKKKMTSISSALEGAKQTEKNFSYYDMRSKSFTNKFLADLSQGTVLDELDPNYWANIPANYLSALNILSDNPIEASTLAENMKTYLNPVSTSIEEYGTVTEMLSDLIGTYQRYSELARNSKKPKGEKQQNAKESVKSSGKSTPPTSLNIKYSFSENVQANDLKSFGNIFFDLPEDQIFNEQETSLKVITMEDFGQYVKTEQEKLFAPNQDVITISSYSNADTSLSRTSQTYFTPTVAINTRENIVHIKNPKISENTVSTLAIDKIRRENKLSAQSFNQAPTTKQPVSPSVEFGKKTSDLAASFLNVTVKPVEPIKRPFVPPKTSNDTVVEERPNIETITRIFDDKDATKETMKAMPTLKKIVLSSAKGSSKVTNNKPVMSMFRPDNLSSMENVSNQYVSDLPNQIKALIVSQDQTESITFGPNTYLNQETTDLLNAPDPFRDSGTAIRAQNFFENICTLEVLSGFEFVPYRDQTQRSLKLPIWKPLSQDLLNRASESGKYLFCRMTPYSNSDFNITYEQEGSLPILEKYFILGTPKQNELAEPLTPANETVNLSMTLNNPLYQVSNPFLYTETATNSISSTDASLAPQVSNSTSVQRPPNEDAVRRNALAQENFSVRTGAPASQSRPLTPRNRPSFSRRQSGGSNNNTPGGGY